MSFGTEFLAQPDLFPARPSGEPWGDETVIVVIAGCAYACTGMSAIQAERVRVRFAGLCTDSPDPSRPSVTSRLFRAAIEDFVDDFGRRRFEFDLDYRADSVRIAGYRVMGRIDWRPGLEASLWTSEDDGIVASSIFENFLRMVVAYHLLEIGGLLLHSSAVVDARGAHVFFGRSGAGKTTISRLGLAAGHRVLSDDMNALRVTDEAVLVTKLPFAGELGLMDPTNAESQPVRTLNALEKGDPPSARMLPPAAAVAALIGCASFLNRDPHRYEQLIDTLQRLHRRIPVQRLTFARDERVWALLDTQEAA